jgi:hypothetical protein
MMTWWPYEGKGSGSAVGKYRINGVKGCPNRAGRGFVRARARVSLIAKRRGCGFASLDSGSRGERSRTELFKVLLGMAL